MSLDEPERTKANVVQHDIRDDRKLHEKKIPNFAQEGFWIVDSRIRRHSRRRPCV